MANIKSQIKRIGTSEARRQRNKSVKSTLKTHIDRFYEAIAAKDKETAKKALALASRGVDKAVSKGVIRKNNAANKKSKMAQAYNKLISEKPAKEAPQKETALRKQAKPKKKFSSTTSKKTAKTKAKKGK